MKDMILIVCAVFVTLFSTAQEVELYEKYHDNGQVKITGQTINKKRTGDWKEFYDTGEVLSEFSYTNGDKDIESVSYYKNGGIHYQTKKVDGKAIRKGFFENGKLQIERIVNTGYYKEYTEDSKLLIESNYVDYQLEGLWKKYYEDGKIEWEVEYKTDYKHGVYRNYYKNGKLKIQGRHKEGKKEGKEKRYTDKGFLNWEGFYLKDKLNKKWKKYNEKGKVVEIIRYNKDLVLNKNKKNIIRATTVPEGVIERVPVYPGCEIMLNNRERKKCLSKKVNQFVAVNFNTDLAASVPGLHGKQKISIFYTIDKDGSVTNIKAKASRFQLEEEAKRVISLLPRVIPGEQRNKVVKVTFYLPITFNVK